MCLGQSTVSWARPNWTTEENFQYTGEIDQDGKACGEGSIVINNYIIFEGTFFNNQWHGI